MGKNIMLAVHCKQSDPLELVAPLRKYVAENYGEAQASDSVDDLEAVASLRREVTGQIRSLPTLKEKMAKYYGTLCAMETRFPFAKGAGHVEAAFAWSDAFKPTKKAEQYNVHFEKAAVLFNLGAVASQLGLQADRSTEEGIKEAARRFQESAGCYVLLRERDSLRVDQPRPVDVSPECAGMLERLMLAQAQECFFEKATKDAKSPAIIARLAQQAALYYEDVAKRLGAAPLSQHFDRAWVSHVAAKAGLYGVEARAQAAAAVAAEDDLQGCGKALARLKEAFTLLQSAKKEAKASGRELAEWAARVEEAVTLQYNKQLRENETVYLQRVPDPASLPSISAASLVKAVPPEGLGPDAAAKMFHGIVPDTSAKAMSRYTDMVDGLVRGALDTLAAASDEARLRLREWELPEALDALAGGGAEALPEGLRGELAAVEANGGAAHLHDLSAQLKELRHVASSELTRVEESLEREAAEDEGLRAQFGARWSRPPSAALNKGLRDKAAGYRSNLAVAGDSDGRLFQKLADNAGPLASCSADAAAAAMPRLQAPMLSVGDAEPAAVVATLRGALDALNGLANQRAALEEALKEEKAKDDILPKLMASSENPEALFKQELSKYDALVAEVDKNAARQREVLQVAAQAQAQYRSAFGYAEWRKACEAASSGLRSSLAVYRELRDNLSEGARFYSALQDAVRALGQQAGDYCLTRRIQRDDLLEAFQRAREGQPPPHAAAQQMASLSLENRSGPPGGYQPPAPQQQPQYHPQHGYAPHPNSNPPPQQPPQQQYHPQHAYGHYGGHADHPPPAAIPTYHQAAPGAGHYQAPPPPQQYHQAGSQYGQPPPQAAAQHFTNPAAGYGAAHGGQPQYGGGGGGGGGATQTNPLWGKQ